MTSYKFDMSAFNQIEEAVQKDIREYISNEFPVFEKVLTEIKEAHLFLYVRDEKIFLQLSFYGRQPIVASQMIWEVASGVKYYTHEDYTEEVDYFGGNTYLHDDFYRTDDPIELR